MFELHMVELPSTPSRALITVFDSSPESVGNSMRLASDLRREGIACEVYLNPGDRLGKQFGYADKLGIPYAVVLGPDEVAQGTATVKDLRATENNQQTVERARLAGILRGE
jgi:histidyl-tRNA synthetase